MEPIGKNAALAARTSENDPLLLVMAADHVIQDNEAFASAIAKAVPLTEEGKPITFGIAPTEPHVGYGYIKRGSKVGDGFKVSGFSQKPAIDQAQEYVNTDIYYWNSGKFLFRASRYLEELKKFRPDIYAICKCNMAVIESDMVFLRINENQFRLCSSESKDYSVMEQTCRCNCGPYECRVE